MGATVGEISAERRREVVLRLRHGNTSRLAPDTALTLALGLLVADDGGRVDEAAIVAASQDPDVVAIAFEVLRKART